ncbi:small acid-soluble spore protein P [Paenibacillus plantiphilus]|uniref:small acid-soluble spore protein P n=1 Tax=Paenibacillus plantiphilus TaxID=2905650 RepID=UPI001F16DE0D|nr:small acid-soluble spore protein P [Paenibacillus plantiphilus]
MGGKSKSVPVPNPDQDRKKARNDRGGLQEPLSGSKKTKQHNHTSHNNPQGS